MDELNRSDESSRSRSPEQFGLHRRFGKINSGRRAVYSTRKHVVEQFGPQIPIAVAESLLYTAGARENSSVNVSSEYGWGWFVCGKKLLVWPVVPSTEKIPPTVIGRELTLPSSDLSHSANLVAVFIAPGNQAPSCMAVSPEGMVRYWHTIGHNSRWVEANTHLGGEEVCAVRYIPPLGCLAVTTSASMILLNPEVVKGRLTVTTKHISLQNGWLKGIGKRMSSIIFGIMPPSHGLESKIVRVLTRKKTEDSWHVFLMAGLTLQSWNVGNQPYEMFFETDLTRMVQESFPDPLPEDSEVYLLDMKYSEIGLVCIAVSTNPRCYMLIEFPVPDEMSPPTECTRLTVLTRQDITVLEGIEGKIPNLQFLPLTTSALIFNNKIILGVSMVGEEPTDGDRLDIPGELVFGGHMYNNIPLFFSGTYGFVSVSPIDTNTLDLLNCSAIPGSPSVPKGSDEDHSKMDYVASVRTAFIYFARKNIVQCKAVISRDFPQTQGCPVDSVLSTTLLNVSIDILNDTSGKDPRWNENRTQSSMSRVSSLHLENQLNEKLKAHDSYLAFVKDLSLWEQLGKVTVKGHPDPVKTIDVLCEHNEKIVAAISLRKQQKEFPEVIEDAIMKACSDHGFKPTPQISNQDYFYRHVSIVDDGLRAICDHCHQVNTLQVPSYKSGASTVRETNKIMIEVAQDVIKRRERIGAHSVNPQNTSWISTPGSRGLFDYLMRQIHHTQSLLNNAQYGVVDTKETIQELFLLTDVVLYTQKDYPPVQKFQDLRISLIRPFIRLGEEKYAAMLGEKYKDFLALIEVCQFLKSDERLRYYMEKYGNDGFCEDVFEWYIAHGKKTKLLELPVPPEHVPKLTAFLERYPRIGWLHAAKNHDLEKTCSMLSKVALKYNKHAIKKERMLAIAKMAAIAGDCCQDKLPELSTQLEILQIQKLIPEDVLTRYGLSQNAIRAFSAKDIIQLFTSEENVYATAQDYIHALELLSYLTPAEAESIKLDIWVRAVLKDQWVDVELENMDKIFVFQLMQLIVEQCSSPEEIIPTVDQLLSHDELQSLNANAMFTYLIKYGYEKVCEPAGIHYNEELNV